MAGRPRSASQPQPKGGDLSSRHVLANTTYVMAAPEPQEGTDASANSLPEDSTGGTERVEAQDGNRTSNAAKNREVDEHLGSAEASEPSHAFNRVIGLAMGNNEASSSDLEMKDSGVKSTYVGYTYERTSKALSDPEAREYVPVLLTHPASAGAYPTYDYNEQRMSSNLMSYRWHAVGQFIDKHHFLPSYNILSTAGPLWSANERWRIAVKAHNRFDDLCEKLENAVNHLRAHGELPTSYYFKDSKEMLVEIEALEARKAAEEARARQVMIDAAVAQHTEEMASLKKQLATLSEENRSLKKIRGQESNEIESLRQMFKAAENEKKVAVEQSTQLEAILEELVTAKASQKALRDASDKREAAIKDLQATKITLEARIARLEAAANSKAVQHDRTEQELTTIREQLNKTKNTSGLQAKEISNAKLMAKVLERKLKAKDDQVTKLEYTLKVMRGERNELLTESENLLQTNKALNSEVAALRKGYGIIDYIKSWYPFGNKRE